MIRRLTAVLTGLLFVCGLAAAPAWAGSQTIGTLSQVSPQAVPFASKVQFPDVQAAKAQAAQANATQSKAAQQGDLAFGAVRADKLEAGLAAKVDSGAIGANDLVDVLVTTSADPAAVTGQLAGVQIGKTFSHALNGFSAKVTRAQLAQLQAMSQVSSIGLNSQVTVVDDGSSYWTGATQVRQVLGVTGDGDGWLKKYSKDDVVIAVVDTGSVESYHR